MKKISLWIWAVVIAFSSAVVACHKEDSPESVAKSFFKLINEKKFIEAQQYATKESKEFLDMLANMSKMAAQNNADSIRPSKEKIIVSNVKITGNNATAEIRTPSEPHPINVSFKKENGKWKVAFDKNSIMQMAGSADTTHGQQIDQDLNNMMDSAEEDQKQTVPTGPTRRDTTVLRVN